MNFFDELLEDETIFTDDLNTSDSTLLDMEDLYTIKQKLISFGLNSQIITELAMKMKDKGIKAGLKWGDTNSYFDASNVEYETPAGIKGEYYINDRLFTTYLIED